MKEYEYYDDYNRRYVTVSEVDPEVLAVANEINDRVRWSPKLDNEDRNIRLNNRVCDYYYNVVGIFNNRLNALINMAVDMIYPYEEYMEDDD